MVEVQKEEDTGGYEVLVPDEDPKGHYHADGTYHLSSDHEDPELYDENAICSERDPDKPKPISKKALRKMRACGHEHASDEESCKPLGNDSTINPIPVLGDDGSEVVNISIKMPSEKKKL